MYLGFEYSTSSGASIGVNDFEIPDDKTAIISNAENEVQSIEQQFESGLLTKGENLSVKAKSNAKFLVISGKPINEEIARGGPFVMNTKAEILQAVQDYHNGTFVK